MKNSHYAQQIVAFKYRHAQSCSKFIDIFCAEGVFGIGQDIRNMDGSALERGTCCGAVAARTNWIFRYICLQLLRSVICHGHPQQLAVETPNESSVSAT